MTLSSACGFAMATLAGLGCAHRPTHTPAHFGQASAIRNAEPGRELSHWDYPWNPGETDVAQYRLVAFRVCLERIGGPAFPERSCKARWLCDFDGDGDVDLEDWTRLEAAWWTTAPECPE